LPFVAARNTPLTAICFVPSGVMSSVLIVRVILRLAS
jgi:hypothetical protein